MAELLSGKASNVPEIPSLNRIRVETALSRFPIHRLAKKGSVAIDIQSGAADFKWEVTHNALRRCGPDRDGFNAEYISARE